MTEYESTDVQDHDVSALYFLLWQDVLERLDTLILEIRHIQKNIIHLLHAPSLYEILSFEQKFLWGGEDNTDNWVKYVKCGNDFAGISTQWIMDFPDIKKNMGAAFSECQKKHDYLENKEFNSLTKITEDAYKTIVELADKGKWNTDQRTYYHNLNALQHIKQNVFRDKLELCALGIKAFVPLVDPNQKATGIHSTNDELSKFIVFRSAILARARIYVERLGDLQQTFTHSQDFGLHDHPRPNLNRRRDQHMYSVHLGDRCKDINREMVSLLQELEVCNFDEHKPVFHHWKRAFTSQSYSFLNSIDNKVGHHNINTSYWMPERPDIQPTIAHEVAHGIVQERLYGLDHSELDKHNDNDFISLIKELNRYIQKFENEIPSHYKCPLEEILVDLLAVTIEGPSYLYALFQEIIGFGLEDIFTTSGHEDRFELDMIGYLDGAFGKKDMIRDWYYRINIVCAWLEETQPDGDEKWLCIRLTNSCKKIVDNLHVYIEKNTPENHKTGNYWHYFSKRLCDIIKESTDVTNTVKAWVKNRDDDSKAPSFNHNYLRCSMVLRDDVRKFLVGSLWSKKCSRHSNEGKIDENVFNHLKETQIPNVYKLFKEAEKNTIDHSSKILFKRLQDIPWQSALLRGLDFVHPESGCLKPKKSPDGDYTKKTLDEMHYKVPLGRELYQIALDFYVHNQEQAWQRLIEVIGILDELLNKLDESKNPLDKEKYDILHEISEKWGFDDGSENNQPTFLKKFIEQIGKLIEKDQKKEEYTNLIKSYSPQVIAKAFEQPVKNSKAMRRYGRAIGLKLSQLYRILKTEYVDKKLSDKPILQDLLDDLQPLYDFLKIREQVGSGISSGTDELRLRLLLALNNTKEYNHGAPFKEVNSLPNAIDLRMFSRICYVGSYYPKISFESLVSETDWNKIAINDRIKQYQLLVGRYDTVSILKTSPMCRCDLPNFKDDDALRTYFVRRELIAPVRLGDKSWDAINEDTTTFVAILAITLKRAGSRLDFMYRLLKVIEHKIPQIKDTDPLYLHHLSEEHISDEYGDSAYLSDSWGDILLIFRGDAKKRLERIFQTQSVIFQDFQVDRTELILTPACFDAAVGINEENEEPQYSLSISVRLMEDRSSLLTNNAFKKHFFEEMHSDIKKLVLLTHTPGRMDFSINLNSSNPEDWGALNKWADKEGLYKKIIGLFNTDVDRVQSNVKRIEKR